MIIQFTVPCVPIAQPRQRHRIVNAGGRTFSSNYTPKRDPVNAFKATIQMAAQQAYQGPPLEGPVALTLCFVFPRPKCLCWKKRAMPRVWHISKPDLDNVVKAVKDSLKSTVWRDDAQVCRLTVEKWIAAGNEQPSVTVEIAPCESPAFTMSGLDDLRRIWE